jgi:hypothetical protein
MVGVVGSSPIAPTNSYNKTFTLHDHGYDTADVATKGITLAARHGFVLFICITQKARHSPRFFISGFVVFKFGETHGLNHIT